MAKANKLVPITRGGPRVGFGDNPALLVIDFIKAFTCRSSPLHAPAVDKAIEASIPLIAAARRVFLPVIFTRVEYQASCIEAPILARKAPFLAKLVKGEPLTAIDERLSPRPEEMVLGKFYPSCFFGTPLAGMLRGLQVDTVMLIGATTSGCIRAAATDAIQHGFRAIVPRECVGDRCPDAHAANLRDIDQRYGDVVDRDECLEILAKLDPVQQREPQAAE